MESGETWDDRRGLVGAGVVLHSAGAEWIEGRVDTLVLAREVGVVPDHGGLVHLREARLLLAKRRLRQDALQLLRLHVGFRERVAPAAFAAFVPDQVKGHSQPPPRRRRVLPWCASPSQRRASPRPRGRARRRSRPLAKPRSPAPRPQPRRTRRQTPTGTARPGTEA